MFLDALVVKLRDGQAVPNHACYLAIGVNCDGERDVLGLWIERTEGAKFWLAVLTELKQRGLEDVLVGCVDGLTGFPDAIEAVYPQTWVQTCIVDQIRSSLRLVAYKDNKRVAADVRRRTPPARCCFWRSSTPSRAGDPPTTATPRSPPSRSTRRPPPDSAI